MTEYSDEVLAGRLKALIDGRGISIKAASEAIGVPYRTLQNQLMGNNRMPASTFLKLSMFLELPAEVIAEGRWRLPLKTLANALRSTLGDTLPTIDGEMRVAPPTAERDTAALDAQAKTLAFILREALERETLHPTDWAVFET